MPIKIPPADIVTAMDEFTLAVRAHERAASGSDDGSALIVARDRLDAAILGHIDRRAASTCALATLPNRSFRWLARMLLSSMALEAAYRLAPAAAEETRGAMVEAGHAMRRDSDLPARQIA